MYNTLHGVEPVFIPTLTTKVLHSQFSGFFFSPHFYYFLLFWQPPIPTPNTHQHSVSQAVKLPVKKDSDR